MIAPWLFLFPKASALDTQTKKHWEPQNQLCNQLEKSTPIHYWNRFRKYEYWIPRNFTERRFNCIYSKTGDASVYFTISMCHISCVVTPCVMINICQFINEYTLMQVFRIYFIATVHLGTWKFHQKDVYRGLSNRNMTPKSLRYYTEFS